MTEPLEPADGQDPFSASSGQLGAPPPPSWQPPADSEAPQDPPPPTGPSQAAPPPAGWAAPGPASGGAGGGWGSPGSSPPPPYPGLGSTARTGIRPGSGPAPYAHGPQPQTHYGAPQQAQPYGAAYPSGGGGRGGQFAYSAGGANAWGRGRMPARAGVFGTGGCWALAICGLPTLGLTWFIGIPASWTAAARLAQRRAPLPFIRRMRGWGIAFIVLSVIALLFWGLLALGLATSSSNGTASATSGARSTGPAASPIPTDPPTAVEPGMRFERVRWGQAVTLHDPVGTKLSAAVPFTAAASALRYPTSASMGQGASGNASLNLRVCATTSVVNPGMVMVGFSLDGVGTRRYGPVAETPGPFLLNLSPGQCRSGRLIFRVPSGAKVTGASYTPIDLNGRGAIWNGG